MYLRPSHSNQYIVNNNSSSNNNTNTRSTSNVNGWLRGTVVDYHCAILVERRSLTSERSLSCARPVADG